MGNYLPSEECIREECKRIRSTWTREERAKRYVGGRTKTHLSIKVVSAPSNLLVEAGLEEAFAWHYLQSKDLQRRMPAPVTGAEVEDEQLFEEVFVPSTVSFG